MLIIPFKAPSVGPVEDFEQSAYDQFTESLQSNTFSAMVGWIIKQEVMVDEEHVHSIKEKLLKIFNNNVRVVNGWKLALYFTSKVMNTN